ncbi:Hypothetical predicted protein [Octopus vulgaris]|uniref:Uncharacterized protein n=1 Tax=Octopus vulgaris TaxID=6645 RepID=A0AA36BHD3_OCTVU|nr:Hypothetical predicted protein [Octopus vulgaris]
MISGDGIVLLDSEAPKDIPENGYKLLGVLDVDMKEEFDKIDKIKEREMKELCGKEYQRKLKLEIKRKLNGRNIILAINRWVLSGMRCGVVILIRNKEVFQNSKRKIRNCKQFLEYSIRRVTFKKKNSSYVLMGFYGRTDFGDGGSSSVDGVGVGGRGGDGSSDGGGGFGDGVAVYYLSWLF